MKTLVVGMGSSGRDCARFLATREMPFDTYDDRVAVEDFAASLPGPGFRHFRAVSGLIMSDYHEVVTSPGIDRNHPALLAARDAGVPVRSEIELASRHARGRIVAVTGTNGKSTTVSLIHHLLEQNGLPSRLCGNIGVPFIRRITEEPDQVYVLEVSSFQLEHIHEFCPDVGVLLNITPDHLDRHGSMREYERSKLRLFENQRAAHLALAPQPYVERLPGEARALAVPGPGARIEGDLLSLGEGWQINAKDFPLLGEHNRLNLLFACGVARFLGLSPGDVARAATSFQGLEHRMERVGCLDGRVWINDSKATNTDATQAALDAMTGRYVLILGGKGKGARFSDLDLSRNPPEAILAYGESASQIVEDLATWRPQWVAEFREACVRAHEIAGTGAAVLLAPACASFDQFKSFEERGRCFKTLFQELKARHE